ncbi:MAG: hypothetical protein FWD24_02580 [Treponema sp.]|nr:hypothetical protein [Treponema sp.]
MNKSEWAKFDKSRKNFKLYVNELSISLPKLKKIQQEFVNSRCDGKNSAYTVETPVVYNNALDEVTIEDEIKLILVADNPGRREQASENKRYLVGPSGKIAKKFFLNNPSLGIDYNKNVIILNKTPIHSPRTIELKELCRMDNKLITALEESQKFMARLLLEFHQILCCPVWITGYSEMKKNGIFEVYTEELKNLYLKNIKEYKQIFFYRHFSMNQFTIDLKQQTLSNENSAETLKRIGAAYKKRILEN